MKRGSRVLVSYSDSEEDEPPSLLPPSKKRKLPNLSSSFVTPVPVDDPSKHQGRIRSTPHVDGQWAAFVYISIPLSSPENRYLTDVIDCAFKRVVKMNSALHPLCVAMDDGSAGTGELHVSLTRPVFLRAHQREEFKLAVKRVAKAHQRFNISFATFAQLTNDERTRNFLCAEIGAGHSDLQMLTQSLSPVLRQFRQKDYYDVPRYHASFAWAHLRCPRTDYNTPQDNSGDQSNSEALFLDDTMGIQGSTLPLLPSQPSKTTTSEGVLLDDLVNTLNSELRLRLSASEAALRISEIHVKIGNSLSRWELGE